MGTYECIERPGANASALLLHPHPDMGGDRHHPVVDGLYRGLSLTTCRFDFSASALAPARQQVVEAIDGAPDPGVILIGYSFGADIALTVDHPRLLAWFLIAPPLRVVDPAAMVAGADPRPKQLAVPERDQFCPPQRAAALTADWRSTTVESLADCDHFLVGRSRLVVDAVQAWLPSILSRS